MSRPRWRCGLAVAVCRIRDREKASIHSGEKSRGHSGDPLLERRQVEKATLYKSEQAQLKHQSEECESRMTPLSR